MTDDVLMMETIQEHAATLIELGVQGRKIRVLRQGAGLPLREENVMFDPDPHLIEYAADRGVTARSPEHFVASLLAVAEAVMPGCVAFVAMREELESATEDAPDDAQELAGDAYAVLDRIGERVYEALLADDGEHLGAWIQDQCEEHLSSFSDPAEKANEDNDAEQVASYDDPLDDPVAVLREGLANGRKFRVTIEPEEWMRDFRMAEIVVSGRQGAVTREDFCTGSLCVSGESTRGDIAAMMRVLADVVDGQIEGGDIA